MLYGLSKEAVAAFCMAGALPTKARWNKKIPTDMTTERAEELRRGWLGHFNIPATWDAIRKMIKADVDLLTLNVDDELINIGAEMGLRSETESNAMTSGFFSYNGKPYLLTIDYMGDYGTLQNMLYHELIHWKQWKEGRLVWSPSGDVYWDGVKYDVINSKVNVDGYMYQPWEVEAYAMMMDDKHPAYKSIQSKYKEMIPTNGIRIDQLMNL